MTNQPAPSDTPTPRTDAELVVIDCIVHGQPDQRTVILPKFCRQLERELTRLSAEREKEEIQLSAVDGDFMTLPDLVRAYVELRDAREKDKADAVDEYKKRLPADWFKDSSLETWFPLTAATLAERDRQLTEAKRALAMAIDAANKGDEARCKAGAMQDMIDDLQVQLADSERQRTGLLAVAQLAYRKHHLDDPDIGWNELGDKLCNALCNAMTDEGFQAWLKTVSNNES